MSALTVREYEHQNSTHPMSPPKPGFLVTGENARGHRVSIFVRRRATADRMVRLIERQGDEDIGDEISQLLYSETVNGREPR